MSARLGHRARWGGSLAFVTGAALFAAVACSAAGGGAGFGGVGGQGEAGDPDSGVGGNGATGGSAGSTAGASGSSGTAGTAGAGGTSGTAGTAGSAGSAGSAGTSGSSGSSGAGGSDASPDAPPSGCPTSSIAPVLTFTLTHASHPGSGYPDVAVHFPPGFDACNRPSLVAFFHGFDNCVSNAIGSVDSACVSGGTPRVALQLAEQLDAAHVNAVLVAVELVVDQSTGNPGNLGNQGEFRALLDELLSQHINPLLPAPLAVDTLDRLVLASHSGGYWAVADVLDFGGVDIDEVQLFDSLYGHYDSYTAWIEGDLGRFDPASSQRRKFSNVFTSGGGTLSLSQTLEAELETALAGAGLSSSLFYQSATAPTPTAAELTTPIVFKHSELSHYGVPLFYFERLLAASGMAALP